MKRNLTTAASLLLLAALVGCGGDAVLRNPDIELPTAPRVDMRRFAGNWFEIARFDHAFQRGCSDSVQTFGKGPTPDQMEVRFSCRLDTGEERVAKGSATILDPIGQAKLDLSLGGLFGRDYSGEYWVLGVAEDYTWALAADDEGEFVWVLGREPAVSRPLRQALLIRLQSLGYDTNKLIWVPHENPGLRALPEGPVDLSPMLPAPAEPDQPTAPIMAPEAEPEPRTELIPAPVPKPERPAGFAAAGPEPEQAADTSAEPEPDAAPVMTTPTADTPEAPSESATVITPLPSPKPETPQTAVTDVSEPVDAAPAPEEPVEEPAPVAAPPVGPAPPLRPSSTPGIAAGVPMTITPPQPATPPPAP